MGGPIDERAKSNPLDYSRHINGEPAYISIACCFACLYIHYISLFSKISAMFQFTKQFITLKKSSLDYRAVGISFRRAATHILKSWSNALLPLNRGVEQAVKGTITKESGF
ncbi:MAG: hypothetical protein JSV50_22020 [Desulfobacteraceae bacterium]|nr:MAG: hypothetical protein JSV50_22020 [Desulfobacteraceae bacterium]